MPLLTWWFGDPLPEFTSTMPVSAQATKDVKLLATLARLPEQEVSARLAAEHVPYLAQIGSVPIAYGWVARHQAAIGELQHQFSIMPNDRYLWDFATLPAWRGRGVYPHLLQAILAQEQAERFWIIHAPENSASARGIHKAGFQLVGTLSFRADGYPALAHASRCDRTQVGARVIGVPLADTMNGENLTLCWHCTIAARERANEATRLVANCTDGCACTGTWNVQSSCYH